ncbi:MFS transporter [Allobranchiibius sp. CTAmp26]|uniref:MFS transporter n=1 Tax=Allobranchiibius sp. CTAmp26 TaxID=2815214 RepID=UPI001AA1BD25|nr:MFS transporter [Allobranchiibius sp. CTAmp26]MBO1753668.1 MFS transporter [Allobranchiibius sp. CTAmp26]
MTAATASADRFDRRLLAPMMLGSILNPVNSSIIAVALVPIGVAFGAPASQTAWLVSALYLATSIGQPLVGSLVDTFGPRRLYLMSTALTGIAGVVGLLAPSLAVLIVARVILGFGTCGAYPASMYLIRSEAERTGIRSPAGVLTALSVATQTIAVIGPTLGGLLIGLGGWRTTFAVNIPLSIACLVLGWVFLPRTTTLQAERPEHPRIDVVGILLFATTLVLLLVFLLHLSLTGGWLLLAAVVVGAGFAAYELRSRAPFIDLRLLAGNVPLMVTYARALVAYTVSYSFIYGFTQWLEDGRGLSAASAGLILLPAFGTGLIVSSLTGRRPQVRGKLIVGAVAQVLGSTLVLLVRGAAPIWYLVLIAVVLGVPQGLNSLAIQNTLYHQADPAHIAASSGLLRTFAYLGAILAAAAGGVFFHAGADSAGLHGLAVFMLIAAVLFFAITVTDRSLRRVDRLARGA